MGVPEWIWFGFLFAFGCCIGSFLNVVIYRLPRDKSLVRPPSSCPACGEPIRFYDNIPLFSWLALGCRCRRCKAAISPRYFIVELLTGLTFVGVFLLFFGSGLRTGVPDFFEGGWLIYLVSITLLSGLIAVSGIDLEHWIIPLSICWFLTAAGVIGSAVAGLVIEPAVITQYLLLPSTSDMLLRPATIGSLAAGALVGIAVSVVLVGRGVLKRSYEGDEGEGMAEQRPELDDERFDHRVEMCREILFLLPIILCSAGAYYVVRRVEPVGEWWSGFCQIPAVSGLLGSVWGYVVGCGIVWGTRILGTFTFNKEAMGLGDVHLMGAAGAVLGWFFVIGAFFVAPFFGLVWFAVQMFFKKTRQIPYGPFLSLGVLTVMILHDRITAYLAFMIYG